MIVFHWLYFKNKKIGIDIELIIKVELTTVDSINYDNFRNEFTS